MARRRILLFERSPEFRTPPTGTLRIQRRCARAAREQQKAPRLYKKINHQSSADNWPGSKFQPPNIMPADFDSFDGGGSMGRPSISLDSIILTELALLAGEVGGGYSFLAQQTFSFGACTVSRFPAICWDQAHRVESKVHTESNVFSPSVLLHLPGFHTDHGSTHSWDLCAFCILVPVTAP